MGAYKEAYTVAEERILSALERADRLACEAGRAERDGDLDAYTVAMRALERAELEALHAHLERAGFDK